MHDRKYSDSIQDSIILDLNFGKAKRGSFPEKRHLVCNPRVTITSAALYDFANSCRIGGTFESIIPTYQKKDLVRAFRNHLL